MCGSNCGSCQTGCGSKPVDQEINIKNLHPTQVEQIKSLFEQFTKRAGSDLDTSTYEIKRLVQKGSIVTVVMADGEKEAPFFIQL